jgi:fructose-bisphosphate aldolase class II
MTKILDVVKPGVVSGDDLQKIFAIAKQEKFALPAVNVVNTDSINAVMEAQQKSSPLSLSSSPMVALHFWLVKV